VFVAALLKDIILSKKYKAFFTDRELRMRHIPHYILCCILIVLGCGWLFSAFLQTDFLKLSIENQASYYNRLKHDVQRGVNRKSPLLVEKDGKWQFEPMSPRANNPNLTKDDFYFTELEVLNNRIKLPPGFMLSSLLLFGELNYPGQNQKSFIHNQILTDILVVPLGKAMVSKMLQTGDKVPVSSEEGQMLTTLSECFVNNPAQPIRFRAGTWLRPCLDYVFPDLPTMTLDYLDTWVPGLIQLQKEDLIGSGFFEDDVPKFMEKAIFRMLKNWEKQNVYPHEKFNQLRQIALLINRISDSYKTLTDLPLPPEKSTLEDLSKWIKKYNSMANEMIQNGMAFYQLAKESGLDALIASKKYSEIEYCRTVQGAYDNWIELLNRDRQMLDSFLRSKWNMQKLLSSEIDLNLWYTTVLKQSQHEKSLIQLVYKELIFLLDGTTGLETNNMCLVNQQIKLWNLA